LAKKTNGSCRFGRVIGSKRSDPVAGVLFDIIIDFSVLPISGPNRFPFEKRTVFSKPTGKRVLTHTFSYHIEYHSLEDGLRLSRLP
jgi:hypothetical protein